jgi:hypothetical protein
MKLTRIKRGWLKKYRNKTSTFNVHTCSYNKESYRATSIHSWVDKLRPTSFEFLLMHKLVYRFRWEETVVARSF